MTLTKEKLDFLRAEVEKRLSPKRFFHTLGVEAEVVALGELYLPEQIPALRAAALLHDITKELSTPEQIALLRAYGIPESQDELLSPQVLHGKTAAAMIKSEFADFALDEIISAVDCHTTGKVGMTVFDCILFLADYIEAGRRWEACQAMRNEFWGVDKATLIKKEHLYLTVIKILENTLAYLKRNQMHIQKDTKEALAYVQKLHGDSFSQIGDSNGRN